MTAGERDRVLIAVQILTSTTSESFPIFSPRHNARRLSLHSNKRIRLTSPTRIPPLASSLAAALPVSVRPHSRHPCSTDRTAEQRPG